MEEYPYLCLIKGKKKAKDEWWKALCSHCDNRGPLGNITRPAFNICTLHICVCKYNAMLFKGTGARD